jgi:C1A family cysteine protease
MRSKKPISISRNSLCVLALTLLSCGIEKSAPRQTASAAPAFVVVGLTDNGTTIHLTGSQQIAFRLPTTPSTGYAWHVVDPSESVVKIGQRRFETGPNYVPGNSGFTWQSVRPRTNGTSELVLELRAPTGNEPPSQSMKIKIVGEDIAAVSNDELPLGYSNAESVAQQSQHPSFGTAQQAILTDCTYTKSKVNLCANGSCTPVKNQLQACGSCWAFAGTAVVENTILKTDWIYRNLSEQYIISCNNGPAYCMGSSFFGDSFNYYQNIYSSAKGELSSGAVYTDDFPYAQSNNTLPAPAPTIACNGPHAHHERIDNWDQAGGIFAAGDGCVKKKLQDGYFLQTFVDASNWTSSGAFFVPPVFGTYYVANHVATIVGYDDTQGVWIVRNSWGAAWGETADGTPGTATTRGYMRIPYGADAVAHDIAWVTYTLNPSSKAAVIMAAMNPW